MKILLEDVSLLINLRLPEKEPDNSTKWYILVCKFERPKMVQPTSTDSIWVDYEGRNQPFDRTQPITKVMSRTDKSEMICCPSLNPNPVSFLSYDRKL